MISKIENIIAFRFLRPKKKEGFLKVISIFSFTGISLGVAILIIVMSVMNGFRTELVSKILGFNPHIIIKSYEKKINDSDKNKLNVEYLLSKYTEEEVVSWIKNCQSRGIKVLLSDAVAGSKIVAKPENKSLALSVLICPAPV